MNDADFPAPRSNRISVRAAKFSYGLLWLLLAAALVAAHATDGKDSWLIYTLAIAPPLVVVARQVSVRVGWKP